MRWTEEAVEVLKELALEGRSASVIAGALRGASRSAVIGKANRIGIKLNGGRGGGGRRDAGVYVSSAIGGPGPSLVPSPRTKLRPALFRAPERKAAPAFAATEVGEMRRLGIEEIHQFVCRWPLGDPTSGDFAYCGLECAGGRSYCAGHCRMAYQPPKTGPAEAKRSWRAWGRSLALAAPEPAS